MAFNEFGFNIPAIATEVFESSLNEKLWIFFRFPPGTNSAMDKMVSAVCYEAGTGNAPHELNFFHWQKIWLWVLRTIPILGNFSMLFKLAFKNRYENHYFQESNSFTSSL